MRSLSYLSLTRGVSVEKIQSSRSVSIRLTSKKTHTTHSMRGGAKKCTNPGRKDSHFLFKSIVDRGMLLLYNSLVISSGPERGP